jgi:hypothetical protein
MNEAIHLPTPEDFAVIARDNGIAMARAHIESACAIHRQFRPKLNVLRDVQLSFVEPIEPGHAFQWIANGGRSADSWGRRQ